MGPIKCLLFSVEFIKATSQPRNITADKTDKALWIITAEQNHVINIALSVVENGGSSLSNSNILDYIKVYYLHNVAFHMNIWIVETNLFYAYYIKCGLY